MASGPITSWEIDGISTWIHHRYTRIPHPEPSSLLPPRTIPLGHPSAPAPSIQYHASNLDWRLISYMILYMFQKKTKQNSTPYPNCEFTSRVSITGYCSFHLYNCHCAQHCPWHWAHSSLFSSCLGGYKTAGWRDKWRCHFWLGPF